MFESTRMTRRVSCVLLKQSTWVFQFYLPWLVFVQQLFVVPNPTLFVSAYWCQTALSGPRFIKSKTFWILIGASKVFL